MDERTWLTTTDPQALLNCIIGSNTSEAIPEPIMRQLRLFYLADWSSRPDSGWPSILHKMDNLREAREWIDGDMRAGRSNECWLLYGTAALQLARDVTRRSAHSVRDQIRLAALLREIFGNPWRPTVVHISQDGKFPGHTSTVKMLAQAIYDEGRWDDLPILADALEEAGSDCMELLMHLRGQEPCTACSGEGCSEAARAHSPEFRCAGFGWRPLRGPHTWGCWAVDFLLPKKGISHDDLRH